MRFETFSLRELQYSIEVDRQNQQQNPQNQQQNVQQKPHLVQPKDRTQQQSPIQKVKNFGAQADNVVKNFRLWLRQRKNLFFYKRYLDRVEGGLYSRYAQNSPIWESAMRGDPVQILRTTAQQYIQTIVKKTNMLYKEVLNMMERLKQATTVEAAIQIVNPYAKDRVGQDIQGRNNTDTAPWDRRILEATRYKFARILFESRQEDVYGYTPKNAALKGFPKPNHLIVTLFIENPQEKPIQQTVADIFASPESFRILADSDKQDIFNVENMTNAALQSTIQGNVMNEIKSARGIAMNNFNRANGVNRNRNEDQKILEAIWKGVNDSGQELLNKKDYLISCINTYYEMILRIDNLAVNSIKSMLEVENANRDKKYDRSLAVGHRRDTNQYDSEGNLVSTKTTRNIDAIQAQRQRQYAKNGEREPGLNQRLRNAKRQAERPVTY